MPALSLKAPLTIVLIDDDPSHADLTVRSLRSGADPANSYKTLVFNTPESALANLPLVGPSVVLCDHLLGNSTGLDWIPDLLRADSGPVILITSQGDSEIAAEAFHRGASDYIDKDTVFHQPDRLWHTISEALRRYRLDQANRDFSRSLKINNQQLVERNQLLNEMTETAHRFVDDVSHEFRTPLTVIQEFASILVDGIGGKLTNDQQEFVQYIDKASQDLSQMVDDFLDTSKLKARSLRVDRRTASFQSILDTVAPIIKTRAAEKKIQIGYQVEPDLPPVFCDTEKAGRVLVNLVVNAIKFSTSDSSIEIQASSDGSGNIDVAVVDHGMGIPEQELKKLGERFQQAGDPRTDRVKGFGLGLNIAKSLVWLNLGRMRIDSTVGQGSVFAFTLPGTDPEHILHCYAQQIDKSDIVSSIAVLRIKPLNPQLPVDAVRSVLCRSCQSLDLLLPSENSRELMVIGPSNEPDKWMTHLQEAWKTYAPDELQGQALTIDWAGTWPIEQLRNTVTPMVLRSFLSEKHCA